jgi:hypothetical protein
VLVLPAPMAFVARIATLLTLVCMSATYVSTASNANTLVFSYTIASGDTTTTGTLVCMIASFVIMIYLCYLKI